MTATGMRSALQSGVPVTVRQRIGCVFEKLKFDPLAHIVQRALPQRFPPALLQAHGRRAAGPAREPWGIVDNVLRRDLIYDPDVAGTLIERDILDLLPD